MTITEIARRNFIASYEYGLLETLIKSVGFLQLGLLYSAYYCKSMQTQSASSDVLEVLSCEKSTKTVTVGKN